MLADQWFVVMTNPQKEAFVADRLRDLRVYFPRFKKITGKIAPLFPRYIFVPLIAEVSQITHTIGVRGLLMAGDHPARMSGTEIAKLKAKERGGLVQLPPPPRFKAGERLIITRGSLRHRTVIHAGMVGKDRERVLIDMLGSHVTLIVRSADLVPEFGPAPRIRLHEAGETSIRHRERRFA